MKKALLTLPLLFCISFAFGQNNDFNNNAIGNQNWSDPGNWSLGVAPNTTNTGQVRLISDVESLVDINIIIKKIQNSFGTSVTSPLAGNAILTIDPGANAVYGIENVSNSDVNLIFKGNVTINNSTTTGIKNTLMRNQNGNANDLNGIIFDSSSVLELLTPLEAREGSGGDRFEFNGTLKGSNVLRFSANTTNVFGSTSSNSGFNSDFVFVGDNAIVEVNTANGNVFLKSGQKIQVNSNNSSIQVNEADVYQGNITVGGSNIFTFGVDANQSSIENIILPAAGVLNLNVGSEVTNLSFNNNSSNNWGTGTVIITGFKEGAIRFGTDNTGLTAGQLSQITADNGGKPLQLDAEGYLVSAPDYTYSGGSWTPSDPTTAPSTATDNILIADGNPITASVLVANSISISTGAELTVSPSGILNIAGEIVNRGVIRFESDNTGSGQLAEFNGSYIGEGEVTAERYISNNRAFRFLASSVTTTNFISNNWQQTTHITGAQGTVGETSADGFDETSTGNPSMYTFDNTYVDTNYPYADPLIGPDQSPGYSPIANTNATNQTVGTAYAMFIRGDRTVDLTSNAGSSETTLSATGSIHTGRFPATGIVQLNTATDHFSLVANPFQAKVAFDNVTKTDLRPDIVVYNPASKTFVTLTGANKIIEPGQSFWVQNVEFPTGPSLFFEENDKAVGGTNGGVTVFSDGQTLVANLELYNTTNTKKDVVKFRFNQNFDDAVNDNDFGKLFNEGENLASFGSMLMSVDRRSIPQDGTIIPLYTIQFSNAQYEFRLVTENWDNNIDVYLIDNYSGTTTLIDESQSYAFSVDSNIPESMATDRFSLSFDNTTLGVADNTFGSNFNLYPNPTKDGLFTITTPGITTAINVEVTNILGQVVLSTSQQVTGNKIDINAEHLPSGIYLVKLYENNQSFTTKVVIE